jgi:hypothetical protein
MGSAIGPTDARLVAIRTVHSIVFLAELGSIVWLVVTGIVGRRDRSVGVAAILVAAESAVFIANDGTCPLTPLAERYGASSGSVSDIWLPDAVARTIPYWTIPLVILGAALHIRGAVAGRQARPAR